jgi:hypothetical protein
MSHAAAAVGEQRENEMDNHQFSGAIARLLMT